MSLAELSQSPDIWFWLIAALALGLVVGISLEWAFTRARLEQLAVDNARLLSEASNTKALQDEREQLMELVSTRLTGTFGDLAQRTMRDNSQTFLQLAEQNLSAQQQKANSALAEREKAVENLVKPIQDALQRSERQINELEKARSQAYGGITEQLTNMQQMAHALQQQTRNLTTALRRPEVRGQWGEITLRRLVEMAGMVEHCDFTEQTSVRSEDGQLLRPDLVIRMPDERELVVDVKTPLDAYLSAVEADNDADKQRFLEQHAKKVGDRISELAKKSYWSQFDKSPEFVILFIPGDQFLTAALNQKPELIDDALRQNIILATPTSFVALLKAVAYGWRQLSLAENAEVIRKLAVDVYDRLATFSEHLGKVGKQLDSSVRSYNQAVGSLERSVLPGARKFTELGVQTKKTISTLEPVESTPRAVASDEANDTDD
ncbi:MAG: DNA recombination protein RmuC [Pseudomonadota bacterium]